MAKIPFDAVVVLGHGSRVAAANEPLYYVARMVAQRLPGREARAAFLQMASPTLEEAVAALYAEGKKAVAVVPFFLYPGAHVREDIPAEVEKLKALYPDLYIEVSSHLGVDPKMAEIVASKVLALERNGV